MDFPGNSHTSRIEDEKKDPAQESVEAQATSEMKKVKKVVTGKVVEKKPPTLGDRFKNMFLHDGGNFAEHIVEKIVVPMVKDMALSIATQMVDGFRQGVEEMLFGPDGKERRGRTTSYGTGRPVVNYTRYSSSSTVRRSGDRPGNDRDDGPRRSNRVKEIIVESREDGDAVIEELEAIIDSDIGHCTVGDFYAACNESFVSTDEGWGWTDLSNARVRKLARDEFLIVMPRPRPIES